MININTSTQDLRNYVKNCTDVALAYSQFFVLAVKNMIVSPTMVNSTETQTRASKLLMLTSFFYRLHAKRIALKSF